MALRLVQIAMNARDDSAVGRFWAEALGWGVSSEEPGVTDVEPVGFAYPDPVAVCRRPTTLTGGSSPSWPTSETTIRANRTQASGLRPSREVATAPTRRPRAGYAGAWKHRQPSRIPVKYGDPSFRGQ
jgi:hypothetical protein